MDARGIEEPFELFPECCSYIVIVRMPPKNNQEQRSSGLMVDLAQILRAEVLPTHLPLVQLVGKISDDAALKDVDLYSKYTRLAAAVGGDWPTVKEELRDASRFGASAVYCSVSAMLAVVTCRRSRSHDDLVSSLKELNIQRQTIHRDNETLNRGALAITTMGHANKADDQQTEPAKAAEASISKLNEKMESAMNTIEKHIELVNKAGETIATMIGRATSVQLAPTTPRVAHYVDNLNLAPVPGTAYRCKYGTLTIDKQSQCTFTGNSLEAKVLAHWLTIPFGLHIKTVILNLNLDRLFEFTMKNPSVIENLPKDFYDYDGISLGRVCDAVETEPRQWSYITYE